MISDFEVALFSIGGMVIVLLLLLLVFWLVMSLIAFGFLVFWIMMLVDAFQRQWPERTTWLVILIASPFLGLGWLTSILYFFLVKRQNPGTIKLQ